jgi:hypothetical protein
MRAVDRTTSDTAKPPARTTINAELALLGGV